MSIGDLGHQDAISPEQPQEKPKAPPSIEAKSDAKVGAVFETTVSEENQLNTLNELIPRLVPDRAINVLTNEIEKGILNDKSIDFLNGIIKNLDKLQKRIVNKSRQSKTRSKAFLQLNEVHKLLTKAVQARETAKNTQNLSLSTKHVHIADKSEILGLSQEQKVIETDLSSRTRSTYMFVRDANDEKALKKQMSAREIPFKEERTFEGPDFRIIKDSFVTALKNNDALKEYEDQAMDNIIRVSGTILYKIIEDLYNEWGSSSDDVIKSEYSQKQMKKAIIEKFRNELYTPKEENKNKMLFPDPDISAQIYSSLLETIKTPSFSDQLSSIFSQKNLQEYRESKKNPKLELE